MRPGTRSVGSASGSTRRPARGCSRSCRRRRWRRGPSCGKRWVRSCGCCSFCDGRRARICALFARSARRSTRGRAGWTGPVLEERPGVAVDGAAGGRAARPWRAAARAAARRRSSSASRSARLEVPAERELQRERCARRRRSSSVSSSAKCARPCVGDPVRLAGPRGRARARRRCRAAARSPSSEPVGTTGAGRLDGFGLLDRAVALEAAQRGIQRAERDAPQRAERLAEALLQLVAVERLLLRRPRTASSNMSAHTIYRIDISIKHSRREWFVCAG